MDHLNLPQLLNAAKRWFDDALLQSMQAAGEQPVTIAQAAVIGSLDPGGTSTSELARRIGTTRQSVHQAVHGLIGMGLLEQVPDPASARSRLVRTTEKGERAHQRAQRMIGTIEEVLAERIGSHVVDALRESLSRSWGDPPLARGE